jgi:tetratricopeptide (TPR) repeat protein
MHDNLLTACEVSLEMGDLPAVEDGLDSARRLSAALSQTSQNNPRELKVEASLRRMQGHLEQAAQIIESCLSTNLQGDNSEKLSSLHVLLAEIMFEQARYTEAAELLEKIINYPNQPESGEQITPLFLLILAYTRLGKIAAAKNLLPRLHAAYAPTIETGQMQLKWGQGHIALAEKRWDQAFNALRAVISGSVSSGRRWHQARASMDLANAYLERGEAEDLDQIRRLLQNALTIFEQIKAAGYVQMIQERLAQITR